MVSELTEASELLSKILNNTLDISKLEEGKIEFNNQYESIRNVISMVLNVSKANAAKKEIDIKVHYDKQLPRILEFDKCRLTQIIMNIIGNAIKFTPSQGDVIVDVAWNNIEGFSRDYEIFDEELKETPKILINGDLTEKKMRSKLLMDTTPRNKFEIGKSNLNRMKSFQHEIDKLNANNDDTAEQIPNESDNTPSPRLKIEKYRLKTNFPVRFLSANFNTPKLSNQSNVSSFKSVQSLFGAPSNTSIIPKDLDVYHNTSKFSKKRFDSKNSICIGLNSQDNIRNNIKKSISNKNTNIGINNKKHNKNKGLKFKLNKSATINIESVKDIKENRINEDAKEGKLIMKITDTGCGMTKEERTKLFKPFSQANKDVCSKFGGTGIGLWLCHKLITAMNGTITCESVPNKGSSFIITLPVKYKTNEIQVLSLIFYRLQKPRISSKN